MSILLILSKNFDDFFDRVPIAGGCWHAEELLDLAEVADRFHLPTIQAQDESVFDRDDLKQPVVVRRETERKSGQRPKSFVQHIHKARYLRAGGLSRERI